MIGLQRGIHFFTWRPFQYESELRGRSIRLLRIGAGEDGDPLNLTVRQHSLDSAVEYIALSYAWGDPNDVLVIHCNGFSLTITKNLHAALRQLRAHRLTHWLWVDAICIDQSNKREKTQQVRMMFDIYHRANEVIAWLGEADESCDKGLNLLNYIFETFGTRGWRGTKPDGTVLDFSSLTIADFSGYGPPSAVILAWDGLVSLFCRPYFSRIWIIQEILASKHCKFLYGTNALFTEPLLQCVRALDNSLLFKSTMVLRDRNQQYRNVASIAVLQQDFQQIGPIDLLDLLFLTRNFAASDPRDRVFALVGLAKGQRQSLINYAKTEEEIMIEASIFILNTGNSKRKALDLLCYSQFSARTKEFPSWVPDWTSPEAIMNPLDSKFCTKYESRLDLKIEYRQNENMKPALLLRGVSFDSISLLVEKPNIDPQLMQKFTLLTNHYEKGQWNEFSALAKDVKWEMERENAYLHKCVQEIMSLESYPTNQPVEEVKWRSILADDAGSLGLSGYANVIEQLSARNDTVCKVLNNQRYLYLLDWFESEYTHTSALVSSGLLYGLVTWKIPKFLQGYAWSQVPKSATRVFLTCTVMLTLEYTFRKLIRLWLQSRKAQDEKTFKHLVSDSYAAQNRLSILTGRCFCLTSKGYVGFVPPAAKIGDLICSFGDYRIPFVIRPTAELVEKPGRKFYQFIGDCYVHGLMTHEARRPLHMATEEIRLV